MTFEHKQIDPEFGQFKPKLDSNYTFPIDSTPHRIIFGVAKKNCLLTLNIFKFWFTFFWKSSWCQTASQRWLHSRKYAATVVSMLNFSPVLTLFSCLSHINNYKWPESVFLFQTKIYGICVFYEQFKHPWQNLVEMYILNDAEQFWNFSNCFLQLSYALIVTYLLKFNANSQKQS